MKTELHKVIVGYDSLLELLLVSFFSSGHCLLEGVPGTAKTLMVRALSKILSLDFCRIQFTPDLMPSDIIGTNVFDLDTGTFHLKKGPIFTNLLLADEINRAPPKTQAALLEAMEERQVTIDGVTHPLCEFMVCATQNPIEYEGTYPLPEAQLDRFMMKLAVPYPDIKEEVDILQLYQTGFDAHNLDAIHFDYRVDQEQIEAIRKEIFQVRIQPEVMEYITRIVRATRESPHVVLGASPRASVVLFQTAKSFTAMQDEQFVTPDTVKRMAFPVMRHRIILKPEAEIEGLTADQVIAECLEKVEVPR
ncbi:MAG: MoxR family ATPase [Theionarchaea archaeon]|nr:MoxR family ATPase [Theionarchaea archaeon]MBU7036972.1 MoxR family ATPase [Theionarchaea archaeon]